MRPWTIGHKNTDPENTKFKRYPEKKPKNLSWQTNERVKNKRNKETEINLKERHFRRIINLTMEHRKRHETRNN